MPDGCNGFHELPYRSGKKVLPRRYDMYRPLSVLCLLHIHGVHDIRITLVPWHSNTDTSKV
jgi:hypothetical protein